MGNTPNIRFKGFTNDWEQRKWIDTVDISTEMVDPTTGEYDDMPHIAPGNIEPFTGRILDNVKTVKEEQLISGKFRFRPNDVVYGKINPQLGKYFYASIDGLTSADAYVFNGKNGITQKFLYSVLQTKDFFKYSISVSKRSGMPKINRDELNAYSFCVPKEEEQEKIGDFLLGIDNLITLHQRKLFLNFAKRNDWEQRKVSDVAKIIAGGTPSTKENSYWEPKEIPWLSSGEVHKKYITFTDDMISQIGMNNSSAKMVAKDSVLIALAGQGKTRGTVAINRIPLTTNQSIAAMTFNENFIPEFVFYNLENRYDELRRMSSGDGSRGGLNKQLVGDIEIPYTEKKEQERIGSFFESLDRIITLHRRAYYNKKGGLTNVHNDNQQHYAIL